MGHDLGLCTTGGQVTHVIDDPDDPDAAGGRSQVFVQRGRERRQALLDGRVGAEQSEGGA
jgi:hypothetical protein